MSDWGNEGPLPAVTRSSENRHRPVMRPRYGRPMNFFGDLERFFVDTIWPVH